MEAGMTFQAEVKVLKRRNKWMPYGPAFPTKAQAERYVKWVNKEWAKAMMEYRIQPGRMP